MHAFAALADPTREEIVGALAMRPRTVNEIVGMFAITQPAISRHLKVLREAGLVRVVPDGKTRVYHLDPGPLREIDRWLERYRRFWAGRLDALEAFMDEEPE
jgi:DNA-binding transcriptional ArsR family regulator